MVCSIKVKETNPCGQRNLPGKVQRQAEAMGGRGLHMPSKAQSRGRAHEVGKSCLCALGYLRVTETCKRRNWIQLTVKCPSRQVLPLPASPRFTYLQMAVGRGLCSIPY